MFLGSQINLNCEKFQPKLEKQCSFPVPIQLIIVILGTGFSYGFSFNEEFGVPIVGYIRKG